MKPRALVVTLALAVAGTAAGPAFAQAVANAIPGALPAKVVNRIVPAPLPAPCSDASIGPAVAGCLAVGGLTPEIAALNRLACLLEGVERFKLAALSCAQRRVNEWQATVMWPTSVLESLRTASLARVRTLREHYEDMLEDWSMPAATQSLASIYGAPKIVVRSEYESVWGRSRGPASDVGDVVSWLSVANRNTIQGRTSAAFGIAGELPENTWERIGREGSKVLAESLRDPLSAVRHTPQMLADRARVESNTLRMQAQTLVTRQVQRDFRRYKRRRELALGARWLEMLAGPYAREAREARTGARS